MDVPHPLRHRRAKVVVRVNHLPRGDVQMKITTIGLDLAKQVFQVHGVNERGRMVVSKRLRRAELVSFFASLPPCLVGMEACAGAHHWARVLGGLGHNVRLMPPQFVKPYVKSKLPQCTAVRRLARTGARTTFKWRQTTTGIDQQARRHLSAHAPHSRRPLEPTGLATPPASAVAVACSTAPTSPSECGHRGHGTQACPHHLGDVDLG